MPVAPELSATPVVGSQRRRGRDPLRVSTRRVLTLRWGAAAILLVVWEALVDFLAPHSSFFASPSAIVSTGLPVFADPSVQKGLIATAERFGIAFGITAVVGLTLGLAIGRLVRVAPVARNVAVVLYAVPQVAFYPLFIIWFGLGQNAEIAFGISHGLLPVLLGTLTAAGQVDPELLDAAKAMGGKRLSRLIRVIVPSCIPAIVSSLRLGASLCLLGVLLAEILVSVDGVGGVLNVLSGTLEAARLNALILGVSVAAVAINFGIGQLEKALSRTRGGAH